MQYSKTTIKNILEIPQSQIPHTSINGTNTNDFKQHTHETPEIKDDSEDMFGEWNPNTTIKKNSISMGNKLEYASEPKYDTIPHLCV